LARFDEPRVTTKLAHLSFETTASLYEAVEAEAASNNPEVVSEVDPLLLLPSSLLKSTTLSR